MKSFSDQVYVLCASMTKTERKYFHAYAHRAVGRSPNYYLLYAEVIRLKEWNEQLLEDRLQKYSFYPHQAVVKNQLYHKLLDALHLYHREEDREELLKRQLHQVYLLLQRDLAEQAHKLWRRAVRQLQTYELYNCWAEALRLKQMLIEHGLRQSDRQKDIKKWQAEHHRINKLLANEQRVKWQKIQLYQQHFYGTLIESSSEEASVTAIDSIMAQADRQQTLALRAFQQKAPRQAYKHNLTQLSLLEKCLGHQRGVPARYLSIFYNLLIDQLQLGAYEELYQGLQKLRELPRQKVFRTVNKLGVKTFSWSFQLELNALLQQNDFAGGYALLTDLQKGLATHQDNLDQPVRASLQHLGGLFAFHQNDFSLALDFLTPLYQQRPDLRQPLYRYAHLLYLLAHYELKHYELLQNILPNTRRSFRQVNLSPTAPVYWVLDLLKSLLDKPTLTEHYEQSVGPQRSTYPADSELENFLRLSRWLYRT